MFSKYPLALGFLLFFLANKIYEEFYESDIWLFGMFRPIFGSDTKISTANSVKTSIFYVLTADILNSQ